MLLHLMPKNKDLTHQPAWRGVAAIILPGSTHLCVTPPVTPESLGSIHPLTTLFP
jgi:hypothetical protein